MGTGGPGRSVVILERWTARLRKHPDTLEGVLEERLMTTAPEFSRAVLEHIRRERA